jgi:CRP-like cAMP-binding protein
MHNEELDLVTTLRAANIFAALGDDVIENVVTQSQVLHFKAGEILFTQGSESAGVYFVISGKFVAQLHQNKELLEVGVINAGELIGEFGALSGHAHALTVQTLEEAKVLLMPITLFKELFLHYASVCVATASPMINRSIHNLQAAKKTVSAEHAFILPADINLPLKIIRQQLGDITARYADALFLAEDEFAQMADDEVQNKIHLLSQNKKFIIYLLNGSRGVFSERVINQANTGYLLIKPVPDKESYNLAIKAVQQHAKLADFRQELIILEENHEGKLLAPWINLADFNLYHKIKLDDVATCKRLSRFLTGRANGLVFGGGSVRAWAHIGAIKAINELKIPIDIVGGVNVGAVIAGLYALGLTHEDMMQRFAAMVEMSKNTLAWYNLTLPTIALFNCKGITLALQKLFGALDIQQLALPYFCTSCNLSTHTVAVHQHGNLFEKIRASIAAPGLFPPMVIDGQLHVDGSLTNSIPIDKLKKILGSHAGSILALALTKFSVDTRQYNFPQVMPFAQGLLYKLGFNRNKYTLPTFGENFLRTVNFGGNFLGNSNLCLADVLVELETADSATLAAVDTTTKEYAQNTLKSGYEKTLKTLTAFYQHHQ